MGNHWEKEKGMGRKGGGGQYTANQDQSGRESHHYAKAEFQVSKKGVQEWGRKEFPSKGGYHKDWVMHSDIILILYISY
jgi:hypothetical protein